MKYYNRDIEIQLLSWQNEKERKPLLIRGARQVGKTATIRNFGQKFKYYIEVNFEQHRDVFSVFEGNLNPQTISLRLSALFNTPVVEGETLLFFDEIQSCLPALASLRFFYEQMPQLHVIAAGSLLEFALSELPSFGVGRIDSMFMYPMSFGEFLNATNNSLLRQLIEEASAGNPLTLALHQKALELLKIFLIIGGMPQVISFFIEKGDILLCQKQLDSLIISYYDDFAKYKKRTPVSLIREVFNQVVVQNGRKFMYSKATELNNIQIKTGLELLVLSGLVIPVTQSAGNGIPLGAEINPKNKKYLIFDTGIFQRINRLNIADVLIKDNLEAINKGAIAELFVGLELVKSATCYQRQELFYWHREAKSSNAEVDYLVQKEGEVIPVEVKSGTKGSMQSLFIFMESKKSGIGIRTSLENFGFMEKVHIYPLYAIGRLTR